MLASLTQPARGSRGLAAPRRVAALAAACSALVLLPSHLSADMLTLISPNEAAQGNFGSSVAGIPDADGDGIDDLIVGASGEDGGGVDGAGRAYVFFGASGALIRSHSSPNDSLQGRYGLAVAGVPDFTGDGRGDYIVAATGELGQAGRVYAYSGATGGLVRTHISPNSVALGVFGRSLAGIDDLNGDSRGDYAIGAPGENGERGRVYVYSGQTGNLIRTHNSTNAEIGGWFGFSVAAVPDADSDNRGDYAIGAPNEDPGASPVDSGRAYIHSGINGALEHTLVSGDPGVNGRFGWSVGGIPDVGGTGGGDVVVGAPNESVVVNAVLYSDAGSAYLFSGTGGFLAATCTAPAADTHHGNQFGWAVAGIPNRNGDARGEILIGAPGWPSYDVHLFEGTNGFGVIETHNSPDTLGANQLWGGAVAAVGDANGDGLGDFIVGGKGSDDFPGAPSESGRAFVYRLLPENDECSFFTISSLSAGSNPFTNIGTSSSNPVTPCSASFGSDLWFTYVVTCEGEVTIDTCNSADFNTVLAVYDGCSYGGAGFTCSLGALVACSNNAAGCGDGSSVTFSAVPGQCFTVRVGGHFGEQGTGTINVSCTQACAGDLDSNGIVDGADLGLLLGEWGFNGAGDLDGNGTIDGADLGILLAAWGPC